MSTCNTLTRMTGAHGSDLVLLLGASMRLTRAVTTDDIGFWLVREPAFRWVQAHTPPLPERPPAPLLARWAEHLVEEPTALPWLTKLYMGLDCPWCVGYWVGLANLTAYVVARRSPGLLGLWRFVAGSLVLNEVAAHLGARLGDTDGGMAVEDDQP